MLEMNRRVKTAAGEDKRVGSDRDIQRDIRIPALKIPSRGMSQRLAKVGGAAISRLRLPSAAPIDTAYLAQDAPASRGHGAHSARRWGSAAPDSRPLKQLAV
jgi:hypothetical protein